VAQEACPLGLAPTASTTATLAMGDALAVALLEARGFTSTDFARSHPGGRLGRRLLLRVEDVMHMDDEIPRIGPQDNLQQALLEMTRKRLGITVIVNDIEQVLGVFTDGDLARALDQQIDIHHALITDLMTSPCKTLGPEMLAAEALYLMETQKVNAFPVVDASGRLVGAFNMHDLLRAGVV
jgi:arabinose-5-phosphate isomerase